MAVPRFILASASPRRKQLLALIGYAPDAIIPADIDETPHKGELAKLLSLRLAEHKAREVHARQPDAVVLASDTVVTVGRRILPKAEDRKTAEQNLRLLSGRRHQVHTAVAVIAPDGTLRVKHVCTRVRFRRMEEWETTHYLDSGEWEGRAGGYSIQGLASAFIPWVNGSYSAVVGLPLSETHGLLVSAGLKPAPATP